VRSLRGDDPANLDFAGAQIDFAECGLCHETKCDVHVATGAQRLRRRRPVFVLRDNPGSWCISQFLHDIACGVPCGIAADEGLAAGRCRAAVRTDIGVA
jgi:hypothetical protein